MDLTSDSDTLSYSLDSFSSSEVTFSMRSLRDFFWSSSFFSVFRASDPSFYSNSSIRLAVLLVSITYEGTCRSFSMGG